MNPVINHVNIVQVLELFKIIIVWNAKGIMFLKMILIMIKIVMKYVLIIIIMIQIIIIFIHAPKKIIVLTIIINLFLIKKDA